MDLRLQKAKVFVAASRSGLGAAAARQFSREGAIVAINGRDAATLSQSSQNIHSETGNTVHNIVGDVSQRETAFAVVQQAVKTMGGLDILVTNAGGPPTGTFEELDLEAWDQAYNLLLSSMIQMIKAALPALRQSQIPAILAITSISAKQPIANLMLSNTIRAGISGLVKTLANELGTEGIRINAILPGYTATDRVEDLLKARSERENISIETARAAVSKQIPLGRMGSPEEFGNTVAFLCSPAAGFIHGAMLPVDGGEIKASL